MSLIEWRRKTWHTRRGQSLIEYAILAGAVAGGIIAITAVVSGAYSTLSDEIEDELNPSAGEE